MNQNQESVLFRTSAATDVQSSGGVLTIAGLSGTKKSRISSILQVKYKAEVAQVVTVTTSSVTPAGSTKYRVLLGDTNRVRNGAAERLTEYNYVTPADITTLGATAALQREAINVALIAKINAASASNFVTAATSTGGAGFTITDAAGYYPAFSQTGTGRLGATQVIVAANPDGSGFVSGTNTTVAVTTAAVYASGVGATLASSVPVVDALYGGLLSGYLQGQLNGISFATKSTTAALNNLPAVSGQNYDIFVVLSLTDAPAHNQRGQLALVPKGQFVAVDNGTGSATTNLSGFKAFERVMHKLMVQVYAGDAATTQQWFDAPLVMQDPLGAAPTGTANTLGWLGDPRYGLLNKTNIGTATVVSPVLNGSGLLLDQDNTNTEGAHYSAPETALGDQSFVVGKTAFMVGARLLAADWTDVQFLVGFRKKAVYTADYNDYTDLAAIGGGAADGDSVYTFGILNNAATVATDTAVNFVDAVSSMVWVKVDINGTVTVYYNGTSYPVYSAGTTALVLDSGDEMIPFFQFTNIGGGDPDAVISEFFAVSTDQLIV